MTQPLSIPLLDETLRVVARRYRLPPMAARLPPDEQSCGPATALATMIELARRAAAAGEPPDPALKRCFIDALAQMIHEAMCADAGDPAFQAMVLRHRVAPVREYASLSAHAGPDRRRVLAAVNAVAHPARLRGCAVTAHGEALARLHALASSGSWSALFETVQCLLETEIATEPALRHALSRLLESPELERLRRLETLASDERVRQYQALRDRHGPRSGSATAAAQGVASKRRGAAVEALAASALEALARRLDEAEGGRASYRVVTSMRMPASIVAGRERAKSEWDVVLLRRAGSLDDTAAWDVCLLVEAKASADAAATDLPRLLRGLDLFAQAQEDAVYPFETGEGVVRLSGASLSAIGKCGLVDAVSLDQGPEASAGGRTSASAREAEPMKKVLYCCDAPAEAGPRLLSAASRMQLLSAPATLEFASLLAGGRPADAGDLEPVWRQLLESPRWRPVLDQYPALRRARELMVHVDDLRAAIRDAAGG